jgi:hypothetical protein
MLRHDVHFSTLNRNNSADRSAVTDTDLRDVGGGTEQRRNVSPRRNRGRRGHVVIYIASHFRTRAVLINAYLPGEGNGDRRESGKVHTIQIHIF